MNNLQQTLIEFTGAQRAGKSQRVAHKLSYHLLASLWLSLMLVAGLAQAGPASIDVTYYHNDLLGSPVAATNDQGELIWRKSYKPYGGEIESTAESEEEFVGYTGHRLDKETGLVYAGARYYDPVIGRFMGYDPVGFVEGNPQSFNRYAYGNNNPYRFVDPDGETPIGSFMPPIVFGSTEKTLQLARSHQEGIVMGGAVALVLLTAGPRDIASEAISQATGIEIPSSKTLLKKYGRGIAKDPVEKLSKVAKDKRTENIGGKFTKTTKVIPGKGPGQSRAEMEFVKNSDGKLIRSRKFSFDRGNKLQHKKPARGGPEGRPAHEN